MLTGPLGASLNFFDYSTKGAWVLSKAAANKLDDIGEEEPPSYFRADERPRKTHDRQWKPSEMLSAVALIVGLVLTFISLFCPIALVGVAVWVLWTAAKGKGWAGSGARARPLTVAGMLCLIALGVLFFGPMMVLWGVPDALAAVALGATSFGFGWAVLLFGSILLLLTGAVK
jgi:hypothetical protein